MNPLNLFSEDSDIESYKSGDTIFSEGEPGNKFYVVKNGELEISVGGKSMETVGSGGIVGELSLISHFARTAAVSAKTDCELIAVDDTRFRHLVSENPFFALHVMDIMAKRLRDTTRQMSGKALWSTGIGPYTISIGRR